MYICGGRVGFWAGVVAALAGKKSSFNTLFRLSMLVRRHRPRGRCSAHAGGDYALLATHWIRDTLVTSSPMLELRGGGALPASLSTLDYRTYL